MALNIAVTSKFDPFTQEDYIKPLANYWKEYEKYEDALYAENAKLAALDPYLGYFTEDDAALLEQYNQYKQSLESARDQMAQGLNAQTRRQIRGDILPKYGSHIVPIQEAFQKKAAAITEYQKQAAHNPQLLSSQVNPLNMSVSSFYGVNNGEAGYFTEDGNKVVNDVKQIINNFTSSHTTSEKVKTGGKEVTRTVTGYNPVNFDTINGTIQFAEGTDSLLADKITQIYSDAKNKYRYDELDDMSKHLFDMSFKYGVKEGWVNANSTSSSPRSSRVPASLGYSVKVRDKNGNEVDAQVLADDGGNYFYLIGGQRYPQMTIDGWQKKYDENAAKTQRQLEAQQDIQDQYRKSKGNKLNYTPSTGGVSLRQDDYFLSSNVGKDGHGGEIFTAYYNDKMPSNTSKANVDVLNHMITSMANRLKDNEISKLMVEKDDEVFLANNTHFTQAVGNSLFAGTKGDDYVLIRYDGSGGDFHMLAVPLIQFSNNLAHLYLSSESNRITSSQFAKFIRAIENQRGVEANTLLDTIIDYAVTYTQEHVDQDTNSQSEALRYYDDVKKEYKQMYLNGSSNNSNGTPLGNALNGSN